MVALIWEDDERDKLGFWLHAALRPGFQPSVSGCGRTHVSRTRAAPWDRPTFR
jgi:hypothetical protein